MKMFPKIYDSATTEAFRVEDYNGKKIEFHYLDDNVNYSKFVSRGKFSVWTSNGVDYRLFIEKSYYQAMADFYLNEVNDIWLNYIDSVYAHQKTLTKKYMLYSGGMLIGGIGLLVLFELLLPGNSMVFLILMGVLFFALFFISNLQRKKLEAFIKEKNGVATQEIKDTIGAKKFEKLLDNEEKFRAEFFKIEEEEEVNQEEQLELTAEEEKEEGNDE